MSFLGRKIIESKIIYYKNLFDADPNSPHSGYFYNRYSHYKKLLENGEFSVSINEEEIKPYTEIYDIQGAIPKWLEKEVGNREKRILSEKWGTAQHVPWMVNTFDKEYDRLYGLQYYIFSEYLKEFFIVDYKEKKIIG